MKVENEVKSIAYRQIDGTEKGNNGADKSEKGKGLKNGSIDASGLNLGTNAVEEKRKKARDMAMQLVKDVFARECEFDGELSARDRHAKELIDENVEHKAMLSDIAKERDNLREMYDVPEGGTEDEELELLRKARDAKSDPSIMLTEEEAQRLEEINDRGVTKYQKGMLDLDENEKEYQEKILDNEREILQEYGMVRGMKLEHLKQHDMVDAVKEGEKIIKAASGEIIGMLRDEVRNNIDEKYKEEKEKAKEEKEEKEELEEQIEAARADDYDELRRAKKEEKEREKMYEIGTTMDEVKQGKEAEILPDDDKSMTQVINELMLSTEDIKGLVVDETL
ncbi:MAG: hypothetical protein NC086_08760 [Alistipes sp.]|nr:hypothetical protein [Alistipes sp.]